MTFTTHTTTSKDGTIIAYQQIGNGQGLIICHGAGTMSQDYEKLAIALSDTFTVYIPDRRGRGLSGQEGEGYDIQKATEDLVAVMQTTSADFIFGHSAGAMIALETMLVTPCKKLAIYEPPISVNHSFPFSWLTEFENALQKGKRKKALAILAKGLNVKGAGKIPLWIIRFLLNGRVLLDRKKKKGTRTLDILPTLTADIKMARELDSKFERYHNIDIPVSLMAGSKTSEYNLIGIKALSNVLKKPKTTIFKGLDHFSPLEKVDKLVDHLKRFYGTTIDKNIHNASR